MRNKKVGEEWRKKEKIDYLLAHTAHINETLQAAILQLSGMEGP